MTENFNLIKPLTPSVFVQLATLKLDSDQSKAPSFVEGSKKVWPKRVFARERE